MKDEMKEASLGRLLRKDIERYTGMRRFDLLEFLKACYHEEALLYGMLFRISRAVVRMRNPVIRFPLKVIVVWILYKLVSVFMGIHIDTDAEIAEGLYIGHYGGIFVGPVKIGRFCNISQMVTIGQGRLGTDRAGRPVIGDRVYIGPGAKVFGKITIGDNVSIGANAVVSKDIPDNAVVVGNPGRIVGYQEENISLQNVFEQE